MDVNLYDTIEERLAYEAGFIDGMEHLEFVWDAAIDKCQNIGERPSFADWYKEQFKQEDKGE